MSLAPPPGSRAAAALAEPVEAAVASPAEGGWLRLLADAAELLKLRVNLLVLFSVVIGFIVASGGRSLAEAGALLLVHTLAGTFLLAGGSSILNQLLERDADALMARTADRPLPAGRLSPGAAQAAGVSLCLAGTFYLVFTAGLLAAALGGVTALLYVLVYTPLKRHTSISILVGAVPGALPPLIGWAAASGTLSGAAWSLFAIQYLWQVPHFLAIAWLYRDDYRKAGYPMVTVLDPSGRAAALQAVSYSLALLPASLFPALVGLSGPRYFFLALALGLCFIGLSASFAVARSRPAARRLLIGSVLYLPLLYLALLGMA
jgi:protoheme IX farnesyltransferase